MPQCLEARAPGGGLTGDAWVRGALQRLIGEAPDFRKGLQAPEDVSAAEARPVIDRLNEAIKKRIDRNGRVSYVVKRPTLLIEGGSTNLGAVTALYEKAKDTSEHVMAVLDTIKPIDPCCDEARLRSTKTVIASTFEALLAELQREPRVSQVDQLFTALLTYQVEDGAASGYLGQFEEIAGLGSRDEVTSVAEYEQFARFRLVRESVECLKGSWETWRDDDRLSDVCLKFRRVRRLLTAVRETVACYRQEVEQVCAGEATIGALPVPVPGTDVSADEVDAISLDSLVDLVDRESDRCNAMLADAGILALPAIRNSISSIRDLVERAMGEPAAAEAAVDTGTAREKRTKHLAGEPGAHTPSTPGAYEIRKSDRLRATQDTAQRLRALLGEVEDHLVRPRKGGGVPSHERSKL